MMMPNDNNNNNNNNNNRRRIVIGLFRPSSSSNRLLVMMQRLIAVIPVVFIVTAIVATTSSRKSLSFQCVAFTMPSSSSLSSRTTTRTIAITTTSTLPSTTHPQEEEEQQQQQQHPLVPIVYTIAGSDSGGGAGIQADLHAIHSFGCHGCSIITCLTAQNSIGVTDVYTPSIQFFKKQLDTVSTDLLPIAIKIGMIGSIEVAKVIGTFLQELRHNYETETIIETTTATTNNNNNKTTTKSRNKKVWVVLDPVMVSTSGHRLIEESTQQAMVQYIFPYVDLVTPNLLEAYALLYNTTTTTTTKTTTTNVVGIEDIPGMAQKILALGAPAVLIKGGHSQTNQKPQQQYVQDYLLLSSSSSSATTSSSSSTSTGTEPRVCDNVDHGCWIQGQRYDTIHTHGTGCTLSSCIASALALGEHSRRRRASWGQTESSATSNPLSQVDDDNYDDDDYDDDDYYYNYDTDIDTNTDTVTNAANAGGGIWTSMDIASACCLAKAYVSAGIKASIGLGKGPGPVAQTTFPNSYQYFPSIVTNPMITSTLLYSSTSASASSTSGTGVNKSNNSTDNKMFFPKMARWGYSKATGTIGSTATSTGSRTVLGNLLPIVDTIEWVERLCQQQQQTKTNNDITDIQLRIKDTNNPLMIKERIQVAQRICSESNVRLWINDHWEATIHAIESSNGTNGSISVSSYSSCYGVHLGQEDLYKCIQDGGIERIKQAGLAIGISTHTYSELAVANGIQPSYVSVGPIFPTASKDVQFDPQGIDTIRRWRSLVHPSIPLCVIGGINTPELVSQVKAAGADCVAVIGAITQSNDSTKAVYELSQAMI